MTAAVEAPAAPRRGGAVLARRRAWTFGLYTLGAVVVLLQWYTATGHTSFTSLPAELTAAGRVSGLLGTYAVLWQLALMARVPVLDRAFGMDRLAVWHRRNGYASLGLLMVHPVALGLAGWQEHIVKHKHGVTLRYLVSFGWGSFVGAWVALGLLVALVFLSVSIVRRSLRYESWYAVHLSAYLAIALASAHEMPLGQDFHGHPLTVWYWDGLYAVTFAALVGFRLLRPLVAHSRHRLRVDEVVVEGPGVVSVWVSGRHISRLHYRAGQFFIWRFLGRGRLWQAHPFSVSCAAAPNRIRVTMKGLGDFSAALASLPVGTPVVAEGPYGKFTRAAGVARKVLYVAGGIGITPIRALVEESADHGEDAVVIYRARTRGELLFIDELDALAVRGRIRVHYVVGDDPGSEPFLRLDARALRALVPDIAERDLYVCGPDRLVSGVRTAACELGLPNRQVHHESFAF